MAIAPAKLTRRKHQPYLKAKPYEIQKAFRTAIAILRWSKKAICEESTASLSEASPSKDMGRIDFHDYRDSKEKSPEHFGYLTCERCGKKFTI